MLKTCYNKNIQNKKGEIMKTTKHLSIALVAVLALSLCLCTVFATTGIAFAEEQTQYILSERTLHALQRYATMLGDTPEQAYDAIVNWLNDENGETGIPFFDEYADVDPEMNADTVRKTKDAFYILALISTYTINGIDNNTNIDDVRNLLDHYMPIKDTFNAFMDAVVTPLDNEQDINDLFYFGKEIYTLLSTSFDDLPYLEENTHEYVFQCFRQSLKDTHEYLETNEDYSFNVYEKYANVANSLAGIADFYMPENPCGTYYLDRLNDYVNLDAINVFHNPNIFNYTREDLDNIIELPYEEQLSTSENFAQTGVYALFQAITTLESVIDADFCTAQYAKDLNGNVGPLLYKTLDLIEALKDRDYPNVCIMAYEIFDDTRNLYDFILSNDGNAPSDLSYEKFVAKLRLGACLYGNENEQTIAQYNDAIKEIEKIETPQADKFDKTVATLFATATTGMQCVNSTLTDNSTAFDVKSAIYQDLPMRTTDNIAFEISDTADGAIKTNVCSAIDGFYAENNVGLHKNLCDVNATFTPSSKATDAENRILTIELRFDTSEYENVTVWYFDTAENATKQLPSKANATDDEYFEIVGDKIVVNAKNAGTLSIAYINPAEIPSQPDQPKNQPSTPYYVWIVISFILLLIILLIIYMIYQAKKQHDKEKKERNKENKQKDKNSQNK